MAPPGLYRELQQRGYTLLFYRWKWLGFLWMATADIEDPHGNLTLRLQGPEHMVEADLRVLQRGILMGQLLKVERQRGAFNHQLNGGLSRAGGEIPRT
jgi:hypothetical protein